MEENSLLSRFSGQILDKSTGFSKTERGIFDASDDFLRRRFFVVFVQNKHKTGIKDKKRYFYAIFLKKGIAKKSVFLL